MNDFLQKISGNSGAQVKLLIFAFTQISQESRLKQNRANKPQTFSKIQVLQYISLNDGDVSRMCMHLIVHYTDDVHVYNYIHM